MIAKKIFICLCLLTLNFKICAEPGLPLDLTPSVVGQPGIQRPWIDQASQKLKGAVRPARCEKVLSYQSHPQYQKLCALLKKYQKYAAQPCIPLETFKVAATHPSFPHLVLCLQRLNYLLPSASIQVQEVENALLTFQKYNRLEPTKTLDPQTLRLLNKPLSFWINRIQKNISRWKKVQLMHDRHILVNIPGFYLYCFSQGQEHLTTPVVVGKQTHKTLCFRARVERIFCHPTWYVPKRLAEEKKIHTAVGYRGYAYDTNGKLIQKPGPDNPLGCIKFSLKGGSGIILHSTNKPSFFKRKTRALSSGCVRVQDYLGLVRFILQEDRGNVASTIENAIIDKKSRSFNVSKDIYCHTMYLTVWCDAQGIPIFYEDIYDYDGLEEENDDDDENNDEDENDDEEEDEEAEDEQKS